MQVDGLEKSFGRLQVLQGVSLDCARGACIALIGPNGSGKTTLIKSMLGMVIPDRGRILFDGKDVAGDHEYRRRIGYMPQISRYPENLRMGRLMDLLMDMRKGICELDTELVDSFRLKDMYDKRLGTLSGGTRQKLAACIAFLFDPDMLILDEPTAGLDPVSAETLREKIVREKARGKLTVISSHVLSELDDLISEVVLLQEGRIRFHSTLESLIRETGELRLTKIIARILSNPENG